MSSGYVYILSNPCMPGIVKIGMTTRSVAQRVNELWQTGVPEPFKVEFTAYCPDCEAAEKHVHYQLDAQRVSPQREFFRTTSEAARQKIIGVVRDQTQAYVERFLPDYTLAHKVLDPAFILIRDLCEEHNVMPEIVAAAIKKIDGALMVEAVEDAVTQAERAKAELASLEDAPF
jgi:hypothetical protein